jgi:F-type H+-transporting ATPase subunit delta
LAKRVSGKRYAQAIFQLAVQQDQVDQWAGDLDSISQVLLDEEFSAFLEHAKVPLSEKNRSIEAVFPDINPLVKNLVALLISRGSTRLIRDVHLSYSQLVDEYRGRQRVEVTSAVPLDAAELERISRFVSELIQKEVVVSTEVDETILGGIVIQVGDQLLDGSVRSRLEGLRRQVRSDVAATAA